MLPHVVQACLISVEVHFCLPCHHLSYTVGPDWLKTISLTQSVPGQPEAAWFSMATHHGLPPSDLILACRVMRASQVLGTWYPFAWNALGSYQTRPLSAAQAYSVTSLPSTFPRLIQSAP